MKELSDFYSAITKFVISNLPFHIKSLYFTFLQRSKVHILFMYLKQH